MAIKLCNCTNNINREMYFCNVYTICLFVFNDRRRLFLVPLDSRFVVNNLLYMDSLIVGHAVTSHMLLVILSFNPPLLQKA